MSTVDEVLNEALELSEEDRAKLARDLLASLETDDFDTDADSAWATEIEARSSAYAKGELAACDWRESLERVRQALSQRRSS